MSNQPNPVASTEHAEAAAPPHPGSPTASAAGGYSSMTTISSMGQLKEIAPDVYNGMMQGIAMQICNEMKHHQDNIKKLMRDASRDAEGRS